MRAVWRWLKFAWPLYRREGGYDLAEHAAQWEASCVGFRNHQRIMEHIALPPPVYVWCPLWGPSLNGWHDNTQAGG